MKPLMQSSFGLFAWTFWGLIVTLLLGCSSATKQPASESRTQNAFSPELVLSNLPPDIRANVFLTASSTAGPTNHLFDGHGEARKEYVSWYRAGVAYVKVTGQAYLRDQVYRKDQPLSVQAMFEGWHDGNADGKLDLDLSLIKSALDSMKHLSVEN
jgi:hypothetical protein